MFCKHCGIEIKNESKYCTNCGVVMRSSHQSFWTNTRKWILGYRSELIVVGLLVVAVALYGGYDASRSTVNPSTTSMISTQESIYASIVNVLCPGSDYAESSGGSGTIISTEGIILTNAHIIPQRNEVPSIDSQGCIITLPNVETGKPAEMYWAEPTVIKTLSKKYDIATLRITEAYVDDEGKSWGTFPRAFPEFPLSACPGGTTKLGDQIRIYGYPVTSGGYNLTITEGIVSSFGDDGTILTSAQIDSGNSGGAAVDQDSCYIGIPSAVIGGNFQSLGVIISTDLISEFRDALPDESSVTPGVSSAGCGVGQCHFGGKCTALPANAQCTAGDPVNAWKCDSGFVDTGSRCIRPTPIPSAVINKGDVCKDKYGPYSYDPNPGGPGYCNCVSGYTFNSASTACISYNDYCAQKYQNTRYTGSSTFTCDCKPGYTWNSDNSACY